VIEIGLILLHCLAEMALAQDEEEVQAFAPHAAQESLANGVGFGLSWPKNVIRSGISWSAPIAQKITRPVRLRPWRMSIFGQDSHQQDPGGLPVCMAVVVVQHLARSVGDHHLDGRRAGISAQVDGAPSAYFFSRRTRGRYTQFWLSSGGATQSPTHIRSEAGTLRAAEVTSVAVINSV